MSPITRGSKSSSAASSKAAGTPEVAAEYTGKKRKRTQLEEFDKAVGTHKETGASESIKATKKRADRALSNGGSNAPTKQSKQKNSESGHVKESATPAASYCKWVAESRDELHKKYHDEEWVDSRGWFADVRCVHNAWQSLFEMLILEGAQAGLSWTTILKKRESYRKAFADFDYERVSKFSGKDVERLLNDPGIVRNKLKVRAAISNAKLFIDILSSHDGHFINYIRTFLPTPDHLYVRVGHKTPATSELSDAISADLKKRGFSFVGSTIMYAWLQAVGIVDDQ
ncbi:hypothetical protein HDU93_000439 [Gonapodya sp. JEL0774]|nr:hypothetical protein HDU93_000439 [Gonapodya sp. JEL0774]